MFQSLGAAAANDRSPMDTGLDEGTKRSSEVDDRRRLPDGMSAMRGEWVQTGTEEPRHGERSRR